MKRFFLYCVGGTVAVMVHYAVLYALVEWYATAELHASMLGFLAALPVNYTFQAILVFKNVEDYRSSFIKYFLVTAATFCLNACLFYVFATVLGIHYLLAQALTIGLLLLVNFSANSAWTFRSTTSET